MRSTFSGGRGTKRHRPLSWCAVFAMAAASLLAVAQPGAAGVVAHWNFDTDFSDSSGNGHTGSNSGTDSSANTLAITSATASSKFGGGALFTGEDYNYVQLASAITLNASPGYAISVWINNYRNVANQDAIILGNESTTDSFLAYDSNYGGIRLRMSGTTVDAFGMTPTEDAGVWHHFVVSVNSTGVTLYKDGSLVGTKSGSNTLVINAIGDGYSNHTGYNMDWYGGIDEVWLFDQPLTAAQAGNLYQYNSLTSPAGNPAVASVNCPTATTLTVAYTLSPTATRMDPTTAQAAGNYTLDGGAGVTGTALQADGVTVQLTTSMLTRSATYHLTVTGVKDSAGNLIAPNPTTLAVAVPAAVLPVITSATATTLSQVAVVYSKSMGSATATVAGHYALNNGATVTSVTPSSATTYVLNTTTLIPNMPYTLTVNGVQDTDTPPNTIAANSTKAFTTPTAPTLTSASATSLTQVVLVYSKAVSAATATAVANYAIGGGSGGAVSAASLAGDNVTVTLTVSTMAATTAYTVTVNNVQDTLGIRIAANSTATFTTPTGALDVPVFILAGQSNMDGRGTDSDIAGLRPGLAITQSATPDKVEISYNQGSGSFAWMLPGNSGGQFGCELSLGQDLAQRVFPTQTVYFIKVSQGGTSLSGGWKPGTGANFLTGCGSNWSNLVTDVSAALATLRGMGYNPVLKGFFWHQGESDNTDASSAAYETNLRAFIADVRTVFSAPTMPFFVGSLGNVQNSGYPVAYINRVIAAQKAVSISIGSPGDINYTGSTSPVARTYFTNLYDLPMRTSDYLHFTSADYIIMGDRFEATYELVTATPPVITSAAATNLTQVRVVYSKSMDAATTTTAGNYALSGGATVLGVTPASATTYLLATSALLPNTAYTLTVSNVKDIDTPQSTIAPNSTAGFTTPAGPAVAITSPASGLVAGQGWLIALSASTTSGSSGAVTGVALFDGAVKLGDAAGAAGVWTYAWNTTAAACSVHNLTAVATDSGGLKATSSPVAVSMRLGGDGNNDGLVDGEDYGVWQNGYGHTGAAATFASGDYNGDSTVDGEDYGVWQNDYGHVRGSEDAVAAADQGRPAAMMGSPPRLAAMTPASGTVARSVTNLTLVFDSDVVIGAGGVEISGLATGPHADYAAAYDAGTRTLTLTFAATLPADVYTVRVVADFVVGSGSGSPLDGETGNPAAATLPSGDGSPGGDARIEFAAE